MIHNKRSCPYGALEYDEARIVYEICTCYRKQSKYCFEHDHKTNSCKCVPQVIWEIKSFVGKRCKWEQCMNYDEYLHYTLNNEQTEKEIKQILGVPTIEKPEKTQITEEIFQTWEQVTNLEKEIEELKQQLKQLQMINQDQENQINELEKLKEEQKQIEILTKEENCKENEENYEYCIPSTILYYKTLYNNEQIIKEEKEKELKEYNDLFKVYQKQEEEK
ncbi:hypothetical protein Glove_522g67 [Diversispora epigaea]|uniref:Uncharacterized protein n=1 Tax=Diversispora epigaea TaxID=1348612 RepID=A0A397GI39_9GLOM|nr:hypothetical protein Glove_522g67 [Diversispora epigaea]